VSFFYEQNGVSKKKKAGADMPVELMHKLTCKACPRNKDNKLIHAKMLPTGTAKPGRVYILGEAPGETEDVQGRQFVGRSGKYLRAQIPRSWEKQIRWNNTIRCRPPNNRNPLPNEIECCRPLQRADIEQYKPEVIILVGLVPTNWLLGAGKQGINAWRGRYVPVKVGEHVCWAYPILHPAGVLRRSGGHKYKSEVEKVFEMDLKCLFRALNKGLPAPEVISKGYTDKITWIRNGNKADVDRVRSILTEMAKEKVCSVDIETKNLRPYKKDSRILSCSVTTKHHGTFVFPVQRKGFWKTEALEKTICAVLKEFLFTSGQKVCHNTKFEQEWFAYYFGMQAVLNTKWADTMAQAYALDSRKGMLNLDVLIFLHFGFRLKALSDIDTRKDMEKYTIHELCEYNGLDTKYTLALFYKLRPIVRREGLSKVVLERVRTGATLVGAQLLGVPANKATADRLGKELSRAIRLQVRKGRRTKAWKKFVAKVGRDPNPDSHPDMVELFDKIMHVKEVKTASGGVTTKDEVLSKLSPKKYPVAPVILQVRSLATIKGTFIDPLEGLVYPDGRLHTSYGHLFTASGRLNSEDPNLQNWPNHTVWKKIREIIEEEFRDVVSFDYGQIEARVIAMASQDDTFVQMLWDEYDVHAEWAQRLVDEYHGCLRAIGIKGKFSDSAVAKQYRQEVKNKWVFPLFFGANEYSVAGNLNLPQDVASYLYHEFWSIFEGIHEWQKELTSLYDRRGYVETLTGRRRYAPCSYNEQINHPIQGTASDIVIDASTRLQDKGIQFNLNVHDDLTFLMKATKKAVRRIAREMCRPTFDFVNVPLVIEVKSGPNWYAQKEIGVFSSNKTFNHH